MSHLSHTIHGKTLTREKIDELENREQNLKAL